MKKLALILSLAAVAATSIYIPSGFQFNRNGTTQTTFPADYTSCITNVDGFNFLAGTSVTYYANWQFPASVVTGTNSITTVYQLTTNDTITSYYISLNLYNPTNGLIYATNGTVIRTNTVANTNFNMLAFTNGWPTNLMQTNIAFGVVHLETVAYTNSPTNSCWLLGGKILFY